MASWAKTHESQSSFSHEKTTQRVVLERKKLMIERGNPLCMLKEKHGHSNSSLETKQNCHWDPDHS